MSKLWIGIECEGRLKGLKTLFIANKTDLQQIILISKENNISHLYFNAGKNEFNDFEIIRKLYQEYTITLEVTNVDNIPLDIIKYCHIMYRILETESLDKIKDTDTIKIESPNTQIYCITKEQMMKNNFDEYKTDKIIC